MRELKIRYAIIFLLVLIGGSAASTSARSGQSISLSGSLKGKIKEQGGKLLEGVAVRAVSAKNKDVRHDATSNDKGEFEFSSLPAGEYSLSFEKQGYKSFTTRKLSIAPGETLKLSRTIELSREGEPYSLIRGATLYGSGFTLPGVIVTIERIDGKRFKQETISREAGEFAFRLRAEKARYRITATARGFQATSIEVEIESDEVRNIALTLKQE